MLDPVFRIYTQTKNLYFSTDRHFAQRMKSILGYTPYNIYLFKLAFHHKSTINNNPETNGMYQSNERLEYLGDALLSFVVGEYLFLKYPSADEGFLTKMRSKIVKRKMLNFIAEQMSIDSIMQEFNSTPISSSMLGNAFEALIGALYLDRGFEESKKFVLKKIIKKYINIDQLEFFDDNYKSQLLEWCQKNGKEIDFRIINKFKADKRDRFLVGVYIDQKEISTAEDYNKKNAEQIASEFAIQNLGLTKEYHGL